MSTTQPLTIASDFADVDILATFEIIELPGSALREGMVLVDEDGLAIGGLDTKASSHPRSGEVSFLIHDLLRGGFTRVGLPRTKTFRVAAR